MPAKLCNNDIESTFAINFLVASLVDCGGLCGITGSPGCNMFHYENTTCRTGLTVENKRKSENALYQIYIDRNKIED